MTAATVGGTLPDPGQFVPAASFDVPARTESFHLISFGSVFANPTGAGHYDGCIEAHNNSLTTVTNALNCGQRPSATMRARLHDVTVDRVATMLERVVQGTLDIAARRVAASKAIRLRFRGRVFRPNPAKAIH